jgi:hypothetical protein
MSMERDPRRVVTFRGLCFKCPDAYRNDLETVWLSFLFAMERPSFRREALSHLEFKFATDDASAVETQNG